MPILRPNGRPSANGVTGNYCEDCPRYIEAGLKVLISRRKTKPLLPDDYCPYCGKSPLDVALVKHGATAVARRISEIRDTA